MLETLAAAQTDAAPALQTAEFEQALSGALRLLGQHALAGDSNAIDVLAKIQQLALRIGDDSNLTLDTDLDTYYIQKILVDQLPKLLDLVGEHRLVTREVTGVATVTNESKVHIL